MSAFIPPQPNHGEHPADYARRLEEAYGEWLALKEAMPEWPVNEPDRRPSGDLELVVRFPGAAGKHEDKFAAVVARRMQVVFGEDVQTLIGTEPLGDPDGEKEWFIVQPEEGI